MAVFGASHLSLVLAMAQPGARGDSFLVSLVPFAMILAIFYFIILAPMKRRQKKVQEFQDALKVGDKVVTTSGIYGEITKIEDRTVTLQVGQPPTRMKFAKAAVGGYQGQEPVVTEPGNV